MNLESPYGMSSQKILLDPTTTATANASSHLDNKSLSTLFWTVITGF